MKQDQREEMIMRSDSDHLSINFVILAAGLGKRLKLDTCKALAEVNGKRMIDYPLQLAQNFFDQNKLSGQIVPILGHKAQNVEDYLKFHYGEKLQDKTLAVAYQHNQKGTGDAVRCFFSELNYAKNRPYTLVMCVDTPLLDNSVLNKLWDKISKENKIDGVMATFEASNPFGLGRVVERDEGITIIEEKDADDSIRRIKEVNSGVYIFKTPFLINQLDKLVPSKISGEYYLTDVVQNSCNFAKEFFNDASMFQGVNFSEELELVSKVIQKKKIMDLRQNGVHFLDSNTVYLGNDVEIGKNGKIYPNVLMEGKVQIGENVTIGMGCVIKDSTIEDGVELKPYSILENVMLRKDCVVGPFARLRPGSDIGQKAKIGNFVETKKAIIESGAKVSHLSYVGDAEIGEDTNIGCGFITCNYDGKNKHKTIIGKKSFIGSDCQTIAPVRIGDSAFIGSGSTINQDVPNKAFAISRARQITKEDMAKRFLKDNDQ